MLSGSGKKEESTNRRDFSREVIASDKWREQIVKNEVQG
jgi:hypothetical protein